MLTLFNLAVFSSPVSTKTPRERRNVLTCLQSIRQCAFLCGAVADKVHGYATLLRWAKVESSAQIGT